jgi:hypothetical protein
MTTRPDPVDKLVRLIVAFTGLITAITGAAAAGHTIGRW